ncbi:hypothetical protein OG2516_01406 [Oceanicola granulosus HTCC2516]|uniref:CopC domain-containing protein n=1 Tax=Oceanicola granulosus (strain ATCC BAA-861 / DSM 15982 / KCTC 12143 / HTCC2516) TaxID=314256 RepID=Q2CG08_OCEGH|nr:copper resistance protein CopC [Oceanicola granulosus]EAR51534.1 hypothetical protein OG2516_01406 [Oceanicola granulosus HTCC2516]
MKTIIFAAALTLTTSALLAHSNSNETTPQEGAIVETVEVIELRFDMPMRITVITLTGPEGEVELTRETGLEPVPEFRALLPEEVVVGGYKVDWRGLSQDGHPMQGTFAFTVGD